MLFPFGVRRRGLHSIGSGANRAVTKPLCHHSGGKPYTRSFLWSGLVETEQGTSPSLFSTSKQYCDPPVL